MTYDDKLMNPQHFESDHFEWASVALNDMFNDMKHSVVSLRQLSYLLSVDKSEAEVITNNKKLISRW